MKCSNCGTENYENQNMCKICGNTLQTLKTDEHTYNQQTHNYNQYTTQEFKNQHIHGTYDNYNYNEEEFLKKNSINYINKNLQLIVVLLLIIIVLLIMTLLVGIPIHYYY